MCRLCDISEAVAPKQTSRRHFLALAGGLAAGLAVASPAFAKETNR